MLESKVLHLEEACVPEGVARIFKQAILDKKENIRVLFYYDTEEGDLDEDDLKGLVVKGDYVIELNNGQVLTEFEIGGIRGFITKGDYQRFEVLVWQDWAKYGVPIELVKNFLALFPAWDMFNAYLQSSFKTNGTLKKYSSFIKFYNAEEEFKTRIK
jgi:hypothetical protein